MKAPLAVPNPSNPRQLRPAHLITDRAKRYRAQNAIEKAPGPKRCVYCGAPASSRRRLDVEHIDGCEANANPQNPANLTHSCRSCNVKKAKTFARHKLGTKTSKFNPRSRPKSCGPGPTKKRGAHSLSEWIWATMTVTGQNDEGCKAVRRAASLIAHTPGYKKRDYAREIWATRRERGTDRKYSDDDGYSGEF